MYDWSMKDVLVRVFYLQMLVIRVLLVVRGLGVVTSRGLEGDGGGVFVGILGFTLVLDLGLEPVVVVSHVLHLWKNKASSRGTHWHIGKSKSNER